MHNVKKPPFIFLFLLISFGTISAITFTPALPKISYDFSISANKAEWTISLFLIGYAIGQLFYGPIANRFGRKIALYIGMILEIIGSIFVLFLLNFHSFQLLIWSRLLMALGASVGLKMTFTLVADTHSYYDARKVTSYLLIAFAIMPSFGVAIGGFFSGALRLAFLFLFHSTLWYFNAFLSCKIQETSRELDPDALKFSVIFRKYRAVLKTIKLPLAAMLMGFGTSTVYVFAMLAPFIALQIMHLNPSQYGLWNLVPIIGTLTGSHLAAKWAYRKKAIQVIKIGIAVSIIGILVMFSAFKLGYVSAVYLFLPTLIMRIGLNLSYSNSASIAMESIKDKSNASAMMSFINVAITTLSVLCLGFFHNITAILLPMSFVILILISVFLVVLLSSKSHNKTAGW